MKSLSMLTLVCGLLLALTTGDAEAAKRLGGGKSSGLQREATTMNAPASTPSSVAAPAPAAKQSAAAPAANAAQPATRSWMGPLAGLAAGLGLAALASHFGFGEQLASMLLIGLIAAVVAIAIGYFLRRRAGPDTAQMQYAGAGMNPPLADVPRQHDLARAGAVSGETATLEQTPGATSRLPDDFDADTFVRHARQNFLRLQAANDAGNLDEIRACTTPQMFAEIKLTLEERGSGRQEVDVLALNASVLDVVEEPHRYLVSVRFSGQIREDRAMAAEPFDEIWHLSKPTHGQEGWVVAGIQQAH